MNKRAKGRKKARRLAHARSLMLAVKRHPKAPKAEAHNNVELAPMPGPFTEIQLEGMTIPSLKGIAMDLDIPFLSKTLKHDLVDRILATQTQKS